MSKVRKTRPRQTDRPMALAIILGTLSVLGASLAYFVIEYSIPNSALRSFFDLVLYNNSSTLPNTALYQQLSNTVDREMALFSEPVAYLIGGIVLGKTVSRRYSQPQVLVAGGLMALVLDLIALSMLWGMRLAGQHGHLNPGQVDKQLVLMQILLTLFWVGLCVVGAEIGLRWKFASQARSETSTAPAAAPR